MYPFFLKNFSRRFLEQLKLDQKTVESARMAASNAVEKTVCLVQTLNAGPFSNYIPPPYKSTQNCVISMQARPSFLSQLLAFLG